MAEENIASLIPEVAMIDGGSSRRYSLGNEGSSKSEEKTVPHYLRASTGSCHDFCKFGKKHEFEEEKPWHSKSRRNTKKPLSGRVDSLDLPQVKSLAAIKLKPSSNSTGHTSDSSEIIKREVSSRLSGSRNPRKQEALSDKSTSGDSLGHSSSSRSRLSDPPRTKKQESSSENVRVFPKEASSRAKGTGRSAKHDTSLELESLPGKIPSSPTHSGSLIGRRVSGISNVKARERTTISKAAVKNTLADARASLSPRSLSGTKQISRLKDVSSSPTHSGDSFGRRLSGISNKNAIKKTVTSKAAVKSTLASPRAPSKAIKKTVTSKATVKSTLASPRAPSKAIKKTVTPKATVKSTLASPRAPSKAMIKTVTSKAAVKNTPASPRAPLKATKRSVASKAAAKSTLSLKPISRNASLTTKQKRSLKDESSLMKQKKVEKAEPELPHNEPAESCNDTLQEKTLYVIKMETETEVFESDKNESCVVESTSLPPSPNMSSLSTPLGSSSRGEGDEHESEWTETEAENEIFSDRDETENVDEELTLDGEQQQRAVMDKTVCSDDKNSRPVKLQFRRGRVVDIQTGHNSPRRLKFRRARTLSDNQNPKSVGRRSFRMREADNVADDSKPSEEKVVLRHQDVQGKKDAQGLFNFVIEETASKLAETRKSKVKALVGAFETVISLQERKPASNIAS